MLQYLTDGSFRVERRPKEALRNGIPGPERGTGLGNRTEPVGSLTCFLYILHAGFGLEMHAFSISSGAGTYDLLKIKLGSGIVPSVRPWMDFGISVSCISGSTVVFKLRLKFNSPRHYQDAVVNRA